MRKRRKSLFGGSVIDILRWRFRDNGLDGLGGGNAGTPEPEPDVEPVNGGPDRDFNTLSSGTVEEPANQPPNPGETGPARVPTDPNQRAGVTQPAEQTQWQSIREAAQAQGFQFDPTVTDDRTALQFLLRQAGAARQENVYAQLGRQLAPQAGQIQQYLQQQTQPQQAQPARQPWEAPEFDERWAALVEENQATGLYVARPGVDPAIAAKVNAYVEWKKGYDRNPAAVINGMVEARSKAIAAETFREQFAAQQRQQTIGQIVNENSAWMYQVDQGGQRMRDYQGQYIQTPLGAEYVTQLRALQGMGVTDPRQQDMLAKQLVRGKYAQQYQSQALAAQQQSVNPQTQQAASQPNRNPLQALPPQQRRNNPAATEPNDAGLSLAERLRRDMQAEGVTDADVFRSYE